MKNPILADPFSALRTLDEQKGYRYYSLPALEKKVGKSSARLPVTIRIMLESLLRNCDGIRVKEEDVLHLMHWDSKHSFTTDNDIPFIVSRVLLQDFTGVPLLVDLAAMRDTVAEQGLQAEAIEPIVPVDLVVDHSVQVDKAGSDDAFLYNLKLEFERNKERYAFLNWGQQAFKTFKVIPPGIGIVHQVNLEHIASLVTAKESGSEQLLYFDTLVGTDSHTTMVNGLGVLGWGVGSIEAEAAMLGQPLFIPAPKVVGVHLYGRLKEAVTATDLTLQITELLRKEKVVGKFVEFFGEGAASLSVADRATISNMAPEYGATTGFFPIDEQTLLYLKMTGRDPSHVQRIKDYLSAQQLFGIPKQGQIDYSSVIELDLSSVVACVAGPKRPQDRLILPQVKKQFSHLLTTSIAEGGYGKNKEESEKKIKIHSNGDFHIKAAHITGGKAILESGTLGFSETEMVANRPLTHTLIDPDYKPLDLTMHHGSIVIAAITSCTNTSNPYVMIGAGLLAKKAVELGLKINPLVKTSLAPGSRVVTDYLEKTGLQKYLNALGFQMIAYGCTTCIGNSGPLDEKIEKAIKEEDMIVASVLSGNRNFEARIHGSVKANFLMSPPLVIAFALAGRIDIDLIAEPLAFTQEGRPVYLKEIWPSSEEIQRQIQEHIKPEMFINRYARILDENPLWQDIATRQGGQYAWDSASTYIQKTSFLR